MWDSLVKEHIPGEIVEKRNDSELAVYFKNGSILRFAGAGTTTEEVNKHRGINPVDVVFDEYSEMPETIWTAIIQPILRENHGTATFIFTPKGKNHSWKLLQMAKDNPNEWYCDVQTVMDTKIFTLDELLEIQRNTPQALYEQEYMCSFQEGAGQFFRRIRNNLYGREEYQPEWGDFQLGVDLGKYQDFTVITPFNLNTFRAYNQDRFNQIDWNLQKARIEVAARKFSNARVKIDRTGIGDPIVEDLKARGLNISDEDSIAFTESMRMNLLNNLSMLLEQDKIQIPNDEGLISELESFQYSLSPLGKIKVSCPENMHDDRVMSLALAVWGVSEMIPIDMELHSPRFAHREQEGQMYVTTYD